MEAKRRALVGLAANGYEGLGIAAPETLLCANRVVR
jgi:hypothetical protein